MQKETWIQWFLKHLRRVHEIVTTGLKKTVFFFFFYFLAEFHQQLPDR